MSDSERKEMLNYGLDKHSAIDVVYPLIDSEFFRPFFPRGSAFPACSVPMHRSCLASVD